MGSANFNVILLKNIKSPVFEALGKISASARSALSTSVAQLNPLGCEKDAHLVTGSLKMIGARGGACIANSIEDLVNVFASKDIANLSKESQNQDGIKNALKALLQGVNALSKYLSAIIDDADDSPLRLWSSWSLIMKSLRDKPQQPSAWCAASASC